MSTLTYVEQQELDEDLDDIARAEMQDTYHGRANEMKALLRKSPARHQRVLEYRERCRLESAAESARWAIEKAERDALAAAEAEVAAVAAATLAARRAEAIATNPLVRLLVAVINRLPDRRTITKPWNQPADIAANAREHEELMAMVDAVTEGRASGGDQ